jgi:PAS domain S-box-containing protein
MVAAAVRDSDHPVAKSASATPAPIDEIRRLAGPMLAHVERSGMSLICTDARRRDNPIVFVNEAFTALTGYRASEALGRNCRFLQGAKTDPATTHRVAAAVESGSQVEAEILNYRRDGSAFWNALFIAPVRDQEGRLAYFLSTQMDVTAARDAVIMGKMVRHNEDALSEVNERLRLALSLAGISAAWEWHIDANRIVGDERFAALYGLDVAQAAEGVGPSIFFSIIHPLDRGRIRLAVGGMLRGAEIFSKEFRLLLPDGAIRWVHARGRCHYDAQERPTCFSGALVDITEQKRVEERLRIAQTAGGVGTFEYIDGFGTASVSAQFCALLGLHSARDLPVRTINDVVDPGDPPIIDAQSHPRTGTISTVEFRITRPDNGERRWLCRRGEYLRDDETAGMRFSGVIYDITRAKLVEDELRTLNDTLEMRVEERTRERDRIWQVSRDLFVLCDLQGLCKSANPAWERELGYAPAYVAGHALTDFVNRDDHAVLQAAFVRLAAGERVDNVDVRVMCEDGSERDISWTCVPEGDAFFAAGRDMTQRNQLEAELRQSQKMEAVGQLTGGIAHDFNNLLTGITGGMALLRTRLAQGRLDEVERYIAGAEDAANRAASLTHRLLAFSRRQTLDPKMTDGNVLVAEMQDLIQRTVGPHIRVQCVLAPDLWQTRCDANQLENALLNLAINARDAMPDGGVLTVTTENFRVDPQSARERDMAEGEYIVISVADNGSGMPAEVIARAFDPFFTTKPLGQGTGLGLSMVYGFAKQSGGQVRILSEVGEGTSVLVYLPRHSGPAEPQAAVGDVSDTPRAVDGETVLVVEDEPLVSMLLTDLLEELGYATIDAADAASGLKVLQSGQRIDLLITDVGLPGGMNGRQLVDAARAGRPALKVLFVTGYAEGGVLDDYQSTPGTHVITKPFAIPNLATQIRAVLSAP